MDYWGAKIYNYCERGREFPTFWAEALNAVSNAAFIIAALIATYQFFSVPRTMGGSPRRPHSTRSRHRHGAASCSTPRRRAWPPSQTRRRSASSWSPTSPTRSGVIFGLHWVSVLVLPRRLRSSLQYAGGIQCRPQFLPITAAASARCLNGTVRYAPAFVALVLMSAALVGVRHPRVAISRGGVGRVPASMTFPHALLRALPLHAFCRPFERNAFPLAHADGVLLYLLLRAAICMARAARLTRWRPQPDD